MAHKPLVAHVVGARPNYMKVAPVYAALTQADAIEQRLVHTGQHYDSALSDVFFAELPLPNPHVRLEVGSGTHGEQTGKALIGLERTFIDLRPDLVLVAGDVNSTLAGALAAAKLQIPVCHLEAGLRSYDDTMPEELNRRVADSLSSLLLIHSAQAKDNLAAEGIDVDRVEFVGNTMIDTLLSALERARRRAAWGDHGLDEGSYLLVTLHRPSLVDTPALLAETIVALDEVSRSLPVIFPVHPRTKERVRTLGVTARRVLFAPPLSYTDFLSLEAGAGAVLTDSGGLQEETTALGIPCYTLRDNTERPITITHGTNTLLGLDPSRIVTIPELMRGTRTTSRPPLWDGRAGERAARAIERLLGVGLPAAA